MGVITDNKQQRKFMFRVLGSTSLLRKYKEAGKEVFVYLNDGKSFTGKLRWFDDYAIKIILLDGSITIPIHNIVYYQCEHFLLEGEVDNVKVFKGRAKPTDREGEQLKKYKRNKELLHFYMKDGSEIIGRLQWYEDYAYAVRPDNSKLDCTITKRQIMYYKKIEIH